MNEAKNRPVFGCLLAALHGEAEKLSNPTKDEKARVPPRVQGFYDCKTSRSLDPTRGVQSTGGSSAVEQRTVK